jgi:hypothetical protein
MPAELDAKNSPPSKTPVVAFELLITRWFATYDGVIVMLVPTKESDVNERVNGPVTLEAKPNPVKSAIPLVDVTV